MLKNHVKWAFRNLWKKKGFSLLNISGLAVGIACAALIFLWIEDEVTFNDYFKNKDLLGQVMTNQKYDKVTSTFASTPGPLAPAMVRELPEIAATARMNWGTRGLLGVGDRFLFANGVYADPDFLQMFSLDFIKGDPKSALTELKSMVVTDRMAINLFNSTDVMGKQVRLDNSQDYTITGVYKILPANSRFQKVDWIIPFKEYERVNEWLQNWGNNGVQTFVQVKAGTDVRKFNAKFAGFIKSKESNVIAEPLIMEMKDWRLRSNFVNGVQQGGKSEQVNLFATIAWIIVLLACINFMNLSTARSERRAREVGVRKVLGTSRSSLVGQFMTEAFLMSFIAVVLAVAITALVLPAFNQLVEKTMELNVFSGNHLMGLLAILLICGLVAGAYPALYLSSFQPIKVLKGLKLPSSGGSAFVRKGLVTLQFVISIALIICTLIIYQQIMHARNRELGWQKENVIYMDQGIVQTRKDSSTDMQFRTLRRALDASGVVSHAALNTNNPFSVGSNSSSYMWKGKDPNANILIGMDFITPEFVGTMGMSLVAGRDFRKDGTEDSASVLINESMAKLMTKDAQDAVGQIIDRDESKLVVVGVLKNFIYNNMYGAAEPVIFYNDDRAQYTNMLHIRIKAGTNLGASLEKVKAVLHAHNPVYPVEYKFMDEEFDRLFQGETLVGTLAGLFAALAIFISCLGLFGLAAFTAERRVKEIGIRKVLGTSMTGIVTLLSKDFIRIVALSCLISFPISWWAMRQWLDSYAYRVQIQWWMFLLPALLALLIALLTVSIQAIKAAMANPIKALRSE